MFVCGSGSFVHQDEDIDVCPITSPTNKKSKRSTSFCKIIGKDNNGTKNNPYSDRGLDKFNDLLAFLDEKKAQIYTTKGSDHISYIRFVYTNSKRVKPIIVVNKNKKQDVSRPKHTVTTPAQVTETVQPQVSRKIDTSNKHTRHGVQEDLRQPRFYVPMIIVLILMFLALFGRTFAIMCTLIMWYLTPMIGGGSTTSSTRRLKTLKKEYVKNASANNLVRCEGPSSPTSVLPSALTDNEHRL